MKAFRKFTLIELLMVMAIIAILAGFILSGVTMVKTTAMKTKTKAQISALMLAMKQYEATYGILPNPGTSNDEYDRMIHCLAPYTGVGTKINATEDNLRGLSFLSGLSNPNDTNKNATIVSYWDIWHQRFKVLVSMDSYEVTLSNGTKINNNVAIWSTGPNGEDYYGTGSGKNDDIPSW